MLPCITLEMKTAYPLTPPPAGQTGATGSDRVGQGEQVATPLACLLQFTIRLPYLERSGSPASTPLESVPRYRAAGTPGAGTPGEVYPVLPYPNPTSCAALSRLFPLSEGSGKFSLPLMPPLPPIAPASLIRSLARAASTCFL